MCFFFLGAEMTADEYWSDPKHLDDEIDTDEIEMPDVSPEQLGVGRLKSEDRAMIDNVDGGVSTGNNEDEESMSLEMKADNSIAPPANHNANITPIIYQQNQNKNNENNKDKIDGGNQNTGNDKNNIEQQQQQQQGHEAEPGQRENDSEKEKENENENENENEKVEKREGDARNSGIGFDIPPMDATMIQNNSNNMPGTIVKQQSNVSESGVGKDGPRPHETTTGTGTGTGNHERDWSRFSQIDVEQIEFPDMEPDEMGLRYFKFTKNTHANI